ncbi:tRNA uracil 4-sulfurtransferase ThiI [Candidatus Fukatsuia anoeciicola]|uniref:tRNA uracil 4-sulfurtransferase ThiI n=1 Tax=Candidatus Fukatsuia anoeciicola TaxID=2994492 RepID=UPI003464894A
MKFIIKLFPEITIKSQSVRLRFTKILTTNIRNLLKSYDNLLVVIRYWDYIEVRTKNSKFSLEICDELTRIPGIHHILDVEERHYTNIHHIFEHTLEFYRIMLIDKTFCVRVKRRGQHEFTSSYVERYIGDALKQYIKNTKVDLTNPQIKIQLVIDQDKLTLIRARYKGLGGFPIGTQEEVLSLISGGFDSGVSSYMLMRRGCRVNFCFFNFGSSVYETNVKQVAYHLWRRFSQSHRLRFITIDFIPIITEILEKVTDSQIGVVLKRMMVRVASKIAERYAIQALVTGEALGQVSSQTLTNLRLIDNASDTLILRPLISYDKEEIIKLARKIGTEDFTRAIPEYCGIISKKPTVKAVKTQIETEESNFDFSILNRVINEAKKTDMREFDHKIIQQSAGLLVQIETVTQLTNNDIVLDIRTKNEQEEKPLNLDKVQILPFYKLNSEFSKLDQSKTYLLYCNSGIMSRLQALYLYEQGFTNIKIFRREKI